VVMDHQPGKSILILQAKWHHGHRAGDRRSWRRLVSCVYDPTEYGTRVGTEAIQCQYRAPATAINRRARNQQTQEYDGV